MKCGGHWDFTGMTKEQAIEAMVAFGHTEKDAETIWRCWKELEEKEASK